MKKFNRILTIAFFVVFTAVLAYLIYAGWNSQKETSNLMQREFTMVSTDIKPSFIEWLDNDDLLYISNSTVSKYNTGSRESYTLHEFDNEALVEYIGIQGNQLYLYDRTSNMLILISQNGDIIDEFNLDKDYEISIGKNHICLTENFERTDPNQIAAEVSIFETPFDQEKQPATIVELTNPAKPVNCSDEVFQYIPNVPQLAVYLNTYDVRLGEDTIIWDQGNQHSPDYRVNADYFAGVEETGMISVYSFENGSTYEIESTAKYWDFDKQGKAIFLTDKTIEVFSTEAMDTYYLDTDLIDLLYFKSNPYLDQFALIDLEGNLWILMRKSNSTSE